MNTAMKVILGVVVGFVLVCGGCSALVVGSMSGDDSGSDDRNAADRAADDREDRADTGGRDPAPNDQAEPEPEVEDEPDETASQANARESAEQYLDLSAFSRSGLIKQLKFEGYSEADATYGVDALDTDYNEQAALSAEQYLDMTPFSRSGLIEQLEFEGYTTEQATYGVDQAGL